MISATKNNAILAAWEKTLGESRDAPAILSADLQVLRTFADIKSEAETFFEKLVAFESGSVVALQIGNSPSWPAVLLACWRAGLVVLPLGGHVESSERELAVETCKVGGIVEKNGAEIKITALPMSPIAWNGSQPDLLKLTSGTTAAPRAVRFRAHQLLADCENICDTMGITDADINFGTIPISHSYGFSNLLTPLLCRGIPLVASEDRMPRAILNSLASSGATVFPGMPVFFQKLAEMEKAPALPRLRLCISAGAPLLKSVAENFHLKFGLKIHTFLGASECGGICYDASDETCHEDGFVGMPMKNVRVTLRDESAHSLIDVRSEAVGDGYFPQDEPEALSDRRFTPGDLVEKTARGLRIAGRVTDVINIAGRKLNPMEIEARLLRFPSVRQVVVFGVPSLLRHEEAVACVAGDVSAAALMQFAHAELGAWQVPKDIWIVDEIPANERGKISRRELARRYLDAHPGSLSAR